MRNTISVPEYLENKFFTRGLIKIEFVVQFLPILDSTNNLSSVFTSHMGGGLERVDTRISRISREWRPGGAPTND